MAKRFSQTFTAYWRGMLQRKAPRARDPGYVDEALNVAFIGGAVQSRPGIRPFNGAPFSGVIRGHGWHVKEDGSRELIVATDAGFQRCVLGGDPIDIDTSNIPHEGNANFRAPVQKVNFLNLSGGTDTTFIYDGTNANLKWDGTNLTKMGLPGGPGVEVPVGSGNFFGLSPTPGIPTPGVGVITKGKRIYVQTLLSAYHEGDCGDIVKQSRTVTNAGGLHSYTFASPTQVSVTPNAANNEFDDPQVIKWRLYRTVDVTASGGSGELRFVGEANIGDVIVDNTSDTTLAGANLVEQLVNAQPQAPIVALVEHRGQLVAAMSDDQSLLRFSNFDPEYMVPEGWPRNFIQPVTHGDGDVITAMRSFYEWCMVFKENSTHTIIGDSFQTYTIAPLLAGGTRAGIGTAFPGSILQVENSVFFASRDGIYRVNRFETERSLVYGGVVAKRMSAPIDDLYAAANFSLGSATFFDRKKRIFVFMGHGALALTLLHGVYSWL